LKSGEPDAFTIPALATRPATATPAKPATPASAVAAVADREVRPLNTATPATSATAGRLVAGVAHVAVADRRLRESAFRRAIIAVRDATPLAEFCEALLRGRLHLCGNCSRYSFGPDPANAGTCSVHGDGLLAFAMPFDCRDFEVSPTPTAPAYLPGKNRAV
jgi:hypothetical protein